MLVLVDMIELNLPISSCEGRIVLQGTFSARRLRSIRLFRTVRINQPFVANRVFSMAPMPPRSCTAVYSEEQVFLRSRRWRARDGAFSSDDVVIVLSSPSADGYS